MKITMVLPAFLVALISVNASAATLFQCRDEGNSIQLEMRPLEKADSSNNTVENIVRQAQKPDTYFRAYPESVGKDLVYKREVQVGYGWPAGQNDSPYESFRMNFADGAAIQPGQQAQANLLIRRITYKKQFYCEHRRDEPEIPRDEDDPYVKANPKKCKRWDMVPQPLKVERYSMACESFGNSDYKDFCLGKSPTEVQSLLFSAAQKRQPGLAEQALACGADINATDSKGCTPLMMSIANLPSVCAATSPLPPDSMLDTKGRFLFNSLASEGAFIDTQEAVTGEASVHKAAKAGSDGVIRDMIELEADLNVQDLTGTTALMLAAESGYWKTIEALVVGGAALGVKDNQGRTAYDRGANLPPNIRETLLEPKVTLTIEGQADGSCSPLSLNAPVGQYVKINLTAAPGKMFMLSIPKASISLMADGGKTASKTTRFDQAGTFVFQCGVHGGKQSQGQIIVK